MLHNNSFHIQPSFCSIGTSYYHSQCAPKLTQIHIKTFPFPVSLSTIASSNQNQSMLTDYKLPSIYNHRHLQKRAFCYHRTACHAAHNKVTPFILWSSVLLSSTLKIKTLSVSNNNNYLTNNFWFLH